MSEIRLFASTLPSDYKSWNEIRAALEDAAKTLSDARVQAAATPNLSTHQELARSLNRLSWISSVKGDFGTAYQTAFEGTKICHDLLSAGPGSPADILELACESVALAGWAKENQGEWATAGQLYAQSHQLARQLAETDPANLLLRRELAASQSRLGRIAEIQGDLESALRLFEEQRQTAESLVSAAPGNQTFRRELGFSLENLGRALEKRGDLGGAGQRFEEARLLTKELIEESPDHLAHQRVLSILLNHLGGVAESEDRLDQAALFFEEAREMKEKLGSVDPENAVFQHELSVTCGHCARIAEKQSRMDEAIRLYENALEISRKLQETEPDNPAHQKELGINLFFSGRARKLGGDLEGARAAFAESRNQFHELSRRDVGFDDLEASLEAVEYELQRLN